MCGIVGYITRSSKLTSDKIKFMEQALLIDTLRGDDSTGVFTVRESINDKRQKLVRSYKKVIEGYNFINTSQFLDMFSFQNSSKYKFVVGHNRSATVGNINLKTAHPFQEGPITLVHNGTLISTHTLPISQHQANAFNDSHTIALNLAKHPVEKIVKELTGAFALVWHDARDDSLNIIRNNKRQFHIGLSPLTDSIFFMSEAEMLHLIDTRLKLGIKNIVQPKAGFWLKFTPKGNLLKPIIKEIDLTPKRSGNYGGTYSGNKENRDVEYNNDWWGKTPNGHNSIHSTSNVYNHEYVADTRKSCAKSFEHDLKLKVSKEMDEELLEFTLLSSEKVGFIVDRCIPSDMKLQKCRVEGNISFGENRLAHGLPAVIYDMARSLYDTFKNRVWSVAPIGIRHLATGESEIICKYINTNAPDDSFKALTTEERRRYLMEIRKFNNPSPPAILDDKGNTIVTAKDIEIKGENPLVYQGPKGSKISATEFRKRTKSGCICCGAMIYLDEHAEIEWVNEGQEDPMCSNCTVEMFNYTKH